MARKFGPKTQAFLIAYRRLGNVAQAADAAGMRRELHYRRLKRDPFYRAEFEAIAAQVPTNIAKEGIERVRPREKELRAEISRLRCQLTQAEIRWEESGKGELLRKFSRLKDDMAEFRKNLRRDFRELKANLPRPRRPRTAEAADTAMPLLDQIAQGMANKPFRKLSTLHQDAVRSIAERLKGTPD